MADEIRMTARYQQNYGIGLLHVGERVNDIFDTIPENGANDDYAIALRKLSEYFKPQVNTEYEVLKFHKCEPMADEIIDAYCMRLRE